MGSDFMKLIIGLGNPGKEYEKTRHNIGFYMLDSYVDSYGLDGWKNKFNGLYMETNLFGEKVIFLKPQSYMNLSGGVVRKFVDFYKINSNDILVISDDLDLNIGNFKLKDKGSSGGHNGLKDIEKNLGTQEYNRLKIGISNNKLIDTKDYVLGKFSKEESDELNKIYDNLKNVIDDFCNISLEMLKSKYNNK